MWHVQKKNWTFLVSKNYKHGIKVQGIFKICAKDSRCANANETYQGIQKRNMKPYYMNKAESPSPEIKRITFAETREVRTIWNFQNILMDYFLTKLTKLSDFVNKPPDIVDIKRIL